MPRPRTYSQAARTHSVTVRVTAEQHAKLRALAVQNHATLASYAEKLLTQQAAPQAANQNSERLPPLAIAELKRLVNALHAAALAPEARIDSENRAIAIALRDVLQVLIADELLAKRINETQQKVSADDTQAPKARNEFQRVVQIYPSRQEGGEP